MAPVRCIQVRRGTLVAKKKATRKRAAKKKMARGPRKGKGNGPYPGPRKAKG